jgi:hypothetical protein
MTTFSISDETCTFGFHNHITLDPLKTLSDQLGRRKLVHRQSADLGNPLKLQKIIENNSSLRVDFGWSFESGTQLETIMEECIEHVAPKYNIGVSNMVTDLRCSWIGFMPLNIFEKTVYEDLSIYGLILFNNEVISFQEEVLTYISNHKVYKQHQLTRNDRYRFNYLKSIRQDENALADAYWLYITAIKETIQIPQIPRDIIEEDLGCHFLYHPELFFELITITKLKGELL